MTPIEFALSQLANVKSTGPDKWLARCPAHEDRTPSLSVGVGKEGQVLFHCFAGCETECICEKIGLSLSDLYPETFSKNGQAPPRNHSRNDAPKGKGIPLGKEAAYYDYRDAEGKLLYQVVRFEQPKDFRQRKPDPTKDWSKREPDPGNRGEWIWSLRNVPLVLYRLKAVLEAKSSHQAVWLTEGEKDCETLGKWGLCGTTNAMGAGKWNSSYTETLAGAHVVILQDNDSPGRLHAETVAKALFPVAKSLRVLALPDLPEHGDVTDWAKAGGTREELLELARKCPNWQPGGEKKRVTSYNGVELVATVFPPMRWAIPNLIPEGLTLLSGLPKLGKSFIVLDVAVGISQGDTVFGKIPVKRGEVLYLALEDGGRRVKDRYEQRLGDAEPSPLFHLELEWDAFGTKDGRDLEAEIKKYSDLRLVIIDTMAKVRREAKKNNGIYKDDYEAMCDIKRVADNTGVACLVVHHDNKVKGEDPFMSISGSTGLTGAADCIISFQRNRKEKVGKLVITGRDIEDSEKELWWDEDLLRWTLTEEAEKRSEEREEILTILRNSPAPLSPGSIAALLGKNANVIRVLLFKMKRIGDVISEKGGYVAAKTE